MSTMSPMSPKVFTTKKQNHIKRPPNSFILWSSEQRIIRRNKISKNKLKINNSFVSKLLGDEWANISKETKLKYKIKADNIKLEHKIKYPEYKYEPKIKRCAKLKKKTEYVNENNDENNTSTSASTSNSTSKSTSNSTSASTSISTSTVSKSIDTLSIVKKIHSLHILNILNILNIDFTVSTDTVVDQTTTILMDHILADKTNFNFLTEL